MGAFKRFDKKKNFKIGSTETKENTQSADTKNTSEIKIGILISGW